MYRKFKADYIFTGYELLDENHVLITDDNGIIQNIVKYAVAGENIEIFKGLLTPGFINCHCHIELSHLKNKIPPSTGLVNFVQQVMLKRDATFEERLNAMKLAEKEMYINGIVAVGDICNTVDSLSIKKNSKLHWCNFIEVSGFVDGRAEKRLNEVKGIQEEFLSTVNHQLSILSPHAPYSVSKKLFQLLNDETLNQLITIHNQECLAEDELYKNKSGQLLDLYKNFGIDIENFSHTGNSSLQSWLPYFTNNQSIISVHNTFITQNDVDFIKLLTITCQLSSLFFCLCPNANQYIESTLPPIDLLTKNNCNLVIGTDSYASNYQLSVLEEIKILLQQNIKMETALKWATINGAKALRMQDRLGSFEKGKQPGIVLIDKLFAGKISAQSSSTRIL